MTNSRGLPGAFTSELQNKVIYQVFLVHLDFDADPAYLWTGDRDLSWNSQTWLGTVSDKVVGGISALEEGIDGRATGVTFSLSGFDPDLLPKALTGDYQGREFNIYVALFDNTRSIISEPQLVMSGEMDQMVVEDGDTGTLTLTGESYAANDQGVNEVRYTAEAQELLYTGDKGLEFVVAMLDVNLLWGTPGPAGTDAGPAVTETVRSLTR